ncbi:MAG: hypothetical protein WC497_05185 [Patescibacteria group bacterium]
MGIEEVLNQTQYAIVAYNNINFKGKINNNIIFSSIHSYLTHCSMISKLLWSSELSNNVLSKSLATILGISEDINLKSYKFRNILEHYDEYLKEWIDRKIIGINILDKNIGSKTAININNVVWIRHFDPSTKIFTLLDEDLDLKTYYKEVLMINNKAQKYLNPKITWDDLDDEEKQSQDENRLIDELSDDYDTDPEDTLERLEDLGLDIEDLNI